MTKRIAAQISLSVINALPPDHIVHDTKLPGFGARRQKDAVSYFVKLRVQGRQRWVTIGRHGMPNEEGSVWTPDSARRQAIKLMGNPALIERQRPSSSPRDPLFADVAEKFLALHGAKLKPRTLEEQARIVRRYLNPAFGTLEIAGIGRAEVEAAHASWRDTPRAANHALAVLSSLMNWAEEHKYRTSDSNPCRRIKHYPQNNRERFLQADELARLGAAFAQAERDGLATPYAIAALRLLTFTGARLSEILTLKWAYVDIERRALLLPDSKTGQKTISLNDPAIAVLRTLPRLVDNPYVIAGHINGARMVNLQKPWRRIRAIAGLDDVRIHDLRHTFASLGAASGGSLPVIGRALGHSQPSTTQRYAHLTDTPVQQLTNAIGEQLAQAMKLDDER